MFNFWPFQKKKKDRFILCITKDLVPAFDSTIRLCCRCGAEVWIERGNIKFVENEGVKPICQPCLLKEPEFKKGEVTFKVTAEQLERVLAESARRNSNG